MPRRRLKEVLEGLDARLSRLGPLAASLAFTALAVSGAVGMHILVRHMEAQPVRWVSILNISIEAMAVALPLIFYTRRVIAELRASRGQLAELTRKLEVAAEESHQANRAKSAFLANMSHELRTPLNAILGFSEIMKDQHLGPVHNPRYLSYSKDIHTSGRYLLGIINDILDLSKIESGKMSLDGAEEFALRPTLEAALALVSGLAGKFEITLSADLPEVSVRLTAVERMIRQVMINLVGNAIKFTPAGGHVHVSCGEAARGGYEIRVRDSGVGMGEEDVAKALTPFGQVANMMSAKHDGTGLGLPLAKAMMELHGGALAIRSAPMQGTEITLYFPPERLPGRARAAA